jgi:hypothetical protein
MLYPDKIEAEQRLLALAEQFERWRAQRIKLSERTRKGVKYHIDNNNDNHYPAMYAKTSANSIRKRLLSCNEPGPGAAENISW